MKRVRKPLHILLIITAAAMVTGCWYTGTHRRHSSVVQYLYADHPEQVITPDIPSLKLPLQVGIAFVPDGAAENLVLTERDKMALMQEVGAHFEKHAFVSSIELIPSAYLYNEGGFANLDQIRTMYGIDVITLLSYDQTQFTDEGLVSLTYWTIIGAYIFKGEKNDTHTMLDAAVYDIQSRKLLFRAPGISRINSRAAPIKLKQKLREDRTTGFDAARADMVENLAVQLDLFREKVKTSPAGYEIVHRPGYTGGGSLGAAFALLLAMLGGYGIWRQRCQ